MLEKPKITDPNQKSKDFLDAKVISGGANEETYEKLGRFETALQKRILAFKTAMILGFYYCGLQFTPKVVQNESKFEQVLDQQLCNLNKINTDPRAASHNMAGLTSSFNFKSGERNMKTNEMWRTGQVPMEVNMMTGLVSNKSD